MKPEQQVMRCFYDSTNQKTTPAQARKTVVQARNLLEAGYSVDQIVSCIQYLVEHPPKKGFTSLGFLSYVINETLEKVKIQKFREVSEINTVFVEQTDTKEENIGKYKQVNKRKIKGMGRF